MSIYFTRPADKQYKKIPSKIQKKADKQFGLLMDNPAHPGLEVKKQQGVNRFEARIDYHYRFTYEKSEGKIIIRTIGMHDVGLGKK